MKFTTPQTSLARGLALVSKSVSGGSLPVLGNVKLEAYDTVALSTTNLEQTITVELPDAKVIERGATTLPYKTLYDLVGTLAGDVALSLTERTQTTGVVAGRTKASIKGIAADEFPRVHRLDPDKALYLDGQALRGMLRGVLYAAARSNSGRPVLESVLLRYDRPWLTLAASDGFRVAEVRREVGGDGKPVSVLLPARSASALASLIDGADEVLMQVDDSRAIFRAGSVEVATMLVDGGFPVYQAIVPKSHNTRAVLDTDAARRAVRSVDIIARDHAHRMDVRVAPGDATTPAVVSLAGEAAETGENKVELDAAVEGGEVKFGVNATYIADVLAAFDAAQTAVELTKPTAPIMLRPVGDDGAWCVVMPFAQA